MTTVRQWTGHESRLLRQAMRLSVRAFAEQLGVATRTVGKWEARGSAAQLRPDSHALLDTMLDRAAGDARERFETLLHEAAGTSVEVISSASGGPRQPWGKELTPRTVDDDSYPQPVPRSADPAEDWQYEEDEDVNRRRFLQAFGALGLTGPNPLVGLETLRHDLLATIGGEVTDLAEWDAIAWEYGCTYVATPPEQLLHDLALDLAVARGQLQRLGDESARRGLQRVVAHLSAYMAQTMGNLGNNRETYRWWRIARQTADASGSAEARVWVRGREILRGLYEHRSLDALLALADEALAISTAPVLGTGSVHSGRAQTLARLGQAGEARRAMTDLYDVVDRLPAHITSDTGSMYGWPEYRLRHAESFVYTHIGDYRRADEAQERALALYPAQLFRERAQVQLHQAMRLIKDGDPAAGSSHAYQAVTALPDSQRIEVVLEVARWAAAAVPTAQRGPEAAELRQLVAGPAASR